ncbi:MAG TPA: cytochrome C oxidase subunit IV family protein [Blastocatellia bacterium]|nr:cytochrome C oxidase subunit IV family protein [Blastocatellia bacterium]
MTNESEKEAASNEPKEAKRLNQIMLGLAGLCVLFAAWDLAMNFFRAGTDDLFLILTALMLAALFAIPPAMAARARAKAERAEGVEEEHALEVHAEAHGGSDRQNVFVWGGLLALTAFEVFLAYEQVNLTLMLIILMGASIIKAALIVAYFMHLKFERLSLILTIVPTLVVLLCLFSILFPDSRRARVLRPPHSVEHVEGSSGEK